MFTVIYISFVMGTFSGTEGTGLGVEVCLQIVLGTIIDNSASVAAIDVWTVSQIAVGKLVIHRS
jgi:hypothetical protein